ncbi:MAG: hypothetical protein KAX20_06325, partial [Candidatus Omnitrophica bacterium]|nr:hypothetical protein [Candidatus Omnitrophota bacterium]
MNQRVKLKRLVLEGFRGGLKEAPLGLEDDCKSLVLFGNNGDGKSSFSDALEWFFTDKIGHLEREGCWRESYFNDALPQTEDAVVEIAFNRSDICGEKILQRKGGYRYSNNTEEFREYVENSCKESFILRYHTMRAFIDKRKKDKLEELEEIIGFEIVKETRDALLRALNSLKSSTELTELRALSNEKGRDIANIIETKPFIEADVLSFADKLRENIGHDKAIDDIDTLASVADELYGKVKITEKGEQIIWLEHVREDVSACKKIPGFLGELDQVLAFHNQLASQREKVEASVLDKLYRAGAEALEKGWAKAGECPLCKRPIDTDQLLEALKKEIEAIQSLLEERNRAVERIKLLRDRIGPLKESLSSLLEDEVKKSLLAPHQLEILKGWPDLFATWRELADKVEDSPESITFELPSVDSRNLLEATLTQLEETIENKKESLIGTEGGKSFYQNIQTLKVLRDNYLRLREIKGKIQIYERQISSLEKINQEFERKEREGLSKVLEVISKDVNEYFKFLHPGEDFDQIELVPTDERGLEFRLKFYGTIISPPLKVLSESHLNSLGISLFLASAKHFNK